MDTSPEYIKQCEKSREIQDDHMYQERDSCAFERIIPRPESGAVYTVKFIDDPRIQPWDIIWLPRQDQLQEMVKLEDIPNFIFSPHQFENRTALLLQYFTDWVKTDKQLFSWSGGTNASMEQLWLAYVMKVKWQKVWNGSDWIVNPA